MFQNERLNAILDILTKKKIISVKSLQEMLFISTSTLRRDLIHLEKAGKIKRKYGTVELILNDNLEYPFLFREQEHEVEKKYIAEAASVFVGNNQTIFVDSSSTSSFLIDHFSKFSNLNVITNGLKAAIKLDSVDSVSTYVAGGKLKLGSGTMLGSASLEYLSRFTTDLCFISCESIDRSGVKMSSEEQSVIKEKMIKSSDLVILLCDHYKFYKKSFYKLCDYDSIDVLVTDLMPPKELIDILNDNNVEIIY